MAKILILGGGFGGVVAAERLAEQLGGEHQITLVSRSRRFVFYPALVRLAFGKCSEADASFDLRESMLNRRINFIEAEVARIDPVERTVTIAHGEIEGHLSYDYLVFALGRRLATERVKGFYEHAHHLLDVAKALNFGKAITNLQEGRVVIGQCAGSRLPVPVYETAFALARWLDEKRRRERVSITVVTPDDMGAEFGAETSIALKHALNSHGIPFVPHFPVKLITKDAIFTADGQSLNFDLLMLLPPFQGSPAASCVGITNPDGYVNVYSTMRVIGHDRIYAVGDCVNFSGPKMGHMAVRQAEVAAANLIAEIAGREPVAQYVHEMKLVIDEGGHESIFLHRDVETQEPGSMRQGNFWRWAKRAQQEYWEHSHS
jgi:sulfide:quinone oxidoreductase